MVDACLQVLPPAAPEPGCGLADEHCCEICSACVYRIRGFRRYECCFTGKEAVKWLLDNQKASTPEEAVILGNDMARAGLLHHVSFKRPFQDRKSFYRYLAQCCTLSMKYCLRQGCALRLCPAQCPAECTEQYKVSEPC